jgi:hypothetical protein
LDSNLVCDQVLVRAVVPGMKSAGYGRIINVISTSVRQPIKGLGVSSTVRGAVANWAKLAGALGDHGQQCLAGRDRDRAAKLREAAGLATIALGRFAEPEQPKPPSRRHARHPGWAAVGERSRLFLRIAERIEREAEAFAGAERLH